MIRRAALFIFLLFLALGGCGTPGPIHKLAGEELAAAVKKAETPAGVSTAEFKELGDSRRAGVAEKLIRATWDESCKPQKMTNSGYAPNGASEWNVVCEGSVLPYDYLMLLPEKSSDTARILKCYRYGRPLTCDLVGRPPA